MHTAFFTPSHLRFPLLHCTHAFEGRILLPSAMDNTLVWGEGSSTGLSGETVWGFDKSVKA